MVTHFRLLWLLSIGFCLCSNTTPGAPLQEARLSRVGPDVVISQHAGAPVIAQSNILLRDATVRTGAKSRAELTFADQTVLRLGDKTEFSFDSASRILNLASGALLTQVPPGVGGTELRVRGITATATGVTLVAESLPGAYTKFICLDGTSRVCLKAGDWSADCILLRAGQMLIVAPQAKTLPEAVDVNLSRFVETCRFITDFAALPAQERVLQAAANQRKQKTRGNFADTDLVIFGRGTIVSRSSSGSSAHATTSPSSSPKKNGTAPR